MFLLKNSAQTYYAYLELTSRCNLRCVYCALSQPDYHGQDFEAAKFDDIVRDLKKRRTRFFMLSGHGETTMIKDWHLLCNKIHGEGMQLMLNTNLSKPLAEDEVETLTKFHMISTSCDTIDPELFAKLRRYAKLETVYANLERIQAVAKKNGSEPIYEWNVVVSDVTVWGLEALAKEGLKRGIQNFNLLTLGNYSPLPDVFQARPLDFLSEEECRRAHQIIENARLMIREGGGYAYVEASIFESLKKNKSAAAAEKQKRIEPNAVKQKSELKTRDCFDPWSTVFIKSNGSIAPCCVHEPITKMEDGKSLSEVLKNGAFESFRQQLIEGDLPMQCQTCTRRAKISVKKFRWKLRFYKIGAFVWLNILWIFRRCSTRRFAGLTKRIFIFLRKT